MSARGRFLSGLITVVIAWAGFATVGALPASATPGTVQYVALGDSYAAGTAIQPDCPHSPDGYPALLDSDKRIHLQANAACSGAQISDVLDQLSALNPGTRLVTLTVGAANLDLSLVLAACAADPLSFQCGAAIGAARRKVEGCPVGPDTLGGDLIDLYDKVAEEAPRARIVVTGYPLLFDPPVANNSPFTDINEVTTDLNCVIERAVESAHRNGANIRYVDVTDKFAGHGIVTVTPPCTGSSAFIHSLLICEPARPPRADPEAFHPTAAGYVAYADAISAVLDAWLDEQAQLV